MEIQTAREDVLADVLATSRLANVIYKQVECGPPWGLRFEKLPRSVFYVLARGSAVIDVEVTPDEMLVDHARISASAGDVVLLPRGHAHTLRDGLKTRTFQNCSAAACNAAAKDHAHAEPRVVGTAPSTTSLLVGGFELDGGRVPSLLSGLPPLIHISAADGEAAAGLRTTVQLLLAEAANRGPGSAIVMQRIADVLLVQILRTMSARASCQTRGVAALVDPAIAAALTAMHLRVSEPWTVERLAAHAGLSRSGFAARFSELVGASPLQYLAQWRMARASELLRDSDEPVARVAERVGYDSLPAFSRAFKRWSGAGPAAHRRDARAARESAGTRHAPPP